MCNHLEQVRAWLTNPNHLNSRRVVNALLVLAVEDIVKYVDTNLRGMDTAHQSSLVGAHPTECAERCREEINALIEQGNRRHILREIILKTLNWWQAHRQMTPNQAGILVARCADQFAAGLVFSNLHDSRPEGTVGMCWWSLIHRVVRQILLKRIFHKRLEEASEDQIQDLIFRYIQIIYDQSERFTYRDVQQAVGYFTHHSIQRALYAYFQERLVSAEVIGYGMENIPDPNTIRPHTETSRERQEIWELLCQRIRRRDDAVRFWVLLQLREDRRLTWDEIVQTFCTQPPLHLLSDDDFFPVTHDETCRAFKKMVQRSASDQLTADALRKFFNRISRKFRRA